MMQFSPVSSSSSAASSRRRSDFSVVKFTEDSDGVADAPAKVISEPRITLATSRGCCYPQHVLFGPGGLLGPGCRGPPPENYSGNWSDSSLQWSDQEVVPKGKPTFLFVRRRRRNQCETDQPKRLGPVLGRPPLRIYSRNCSNSSSSSLNLQESDKEEVTGDGTMTLKEKATTSTYESRWHDQTEQPKGLGPILGRPPLRIYSRNCSKSSSSLNHEVSDEEEVTRVRKGLGPILGRLPLRIYPRNCSKSSSSLNHEVSDEEEVTSVRTMTPKEKETPLPDGSPRRHQPDQLARLRLGQDRPGSSGVNSSSSSNVPNFALKNSNISASSDFSASSSRNKRQRFSELLTPRNKRLETAPVSRRIHK